MVMVTARIVITVVTVTTMTMVHEDVHQGTGENEQKWQPAIEVCPVF